MRMDFLIRLMGTVTSNETATISRTIIHSHYAKSHHNVNIIILYLQEKNTVFVANIA